MSRRYNKDREAYQVWVALSQIPDKVKAHGDNHEAQAKTFLEEVSKAKAKPFTLLSVIARVAGRDGTNIKHAWIKGEHGNGIAFKGEKPLVDPQTVINNQLSVPDPE